MTDQPLLSAEEQHRAECYQRALAVVAGNLAAGRAIRAEGERRSRSWTRRAEDSELLDTLTNEISRLRDLLAEREQYVAELETRLALAVERSNAERTDHAALRRRVGLDAESLRRMLGAVS